ncbi:6611_t:CDS:2, partial [Cetraspora pellucida]
LLNNQNKQLKKSIKKLQKSKDRMTHKVQQLNGSVIQLKHKHHHHISRVRAVTKRPPELKDNDLRTLTVQVSQIGQMSFNTAAESIKTVFNFLTGDNTESWLSVNTVSHWHREVSKLNVRNAFQQANRSTHFAFGIMTDESGCGEKKILMECFMFWNSEKNIPDIVLLETKDLWQYNSDTVSQALFKSYIKYKLDTSRCLTFLSDNTNYMSGHVGGVVTKFNQLAQSHCV